MAVVFEEILPSPVEHETSEPAGMSWLPASANNGGANSNDSTTSEVLFIAGLQGEAFDLYTDTSRYINFRAEKLTGFPEIHGQTQARCESFVWDEKYFGACNPMGQISVVPAAHWRYPAATR
jgi:hypothetical protein